MIVLWSKKHWIWFLLPNNYGNYCTVWIVCQQSSFSAICCSDLIKIFFWCYSLHFFGCCYYFCSISVRTIKTLQQCERHLSVCLFHFFVRYSTIIIESIIRNNNKRKVWLLFIAHSFWWKWFIHFCGVAVAC